MKKIEKALQDLAKAVESNESVSKINITITLRKSSKAKATADK